MNTNWKKLTGILAALILATGLARGQEEGTQEATPASPPPAKPETVGSGATIGAEIGNDGGGRIVVEAKGLRPKLAVLFKASASAQVVAGTERINQGVRLHLEVVQGEAETLTLELIGPGEVYAVEGGNLRSWAVRREGDQRFLDLRVKKGLKEFKPLVRMRSAEYELPAEMDVTNLGPGKAVGFNAVVKMDFVEAVDGRVVAADGFLPVGKEVTLDQFQSGTGGRLRVRLTRSGALPGEVELSGATLTGAVDAKGEYVTFKMKATAVVKKADVVVDLLKGTAAMSSLPENALYRVQLAQNGAETFYKLVFDEPGEYPVELEFSSMIRMSNGWKTVDFNLHAGAIVPLSLTGIAKDSEFLRKEGVAMLPIEDGKEWRGFLPVNGLARFSWKPARKTGEGKLFFTSTGKVETMVGAGLLRQNHHVDIRVLQGELDALQLEIKGAGEVLEVSGTNVVGWNVVENAGERFLDVKLSQPVESSGVFLVRTQSALEALPVTVRPLRLSPRGVVRHSGYVRLTNEGSVRLTPSGLSGLTQLSPDQFPGQAVGARQVFVYRFPSAEYDFEVTAERIQPEVNVSQVVLYQLGETDRVITINIEFDIREAPIREWDLGIPEDYSVVAVSGAQVADYVVGTAPENGRRSLKVLFGQDVSGRQLVNLHLEKNEPASAGDWVLPRISFGGAKSVRGDVGVVGAAGFRIGVGAIDKLAEKPLSYFPNPVPNLQQTFRIRERDWSATVTVEQLDKSVQADVFHLYSLSEGKAFASVIVNYFVTGAPVSEWEIKVPKSVENVVVDGLDVRTWRQEEDKLIVTLHQPVMGSYTLLLTFEEEIGATGGSLSAGGMEPLGVQGERGFIHVVSPVLVHSEVTSASEGLLKLDPLELPAEFRLLTSFPSLAVYQYTERPFSLSFNVSWFKPGSTTGQVVEFSDVKSRVSADGQLVTDVSYFVKSRGRQPLRLQLPEGVELWAVRVGDQNVTARQDGGDYLIPLPGMADPNIPVEVVVNLAKPGTEGVETTIELPKVSSLILKTEWEITGEEEQMILPMGGTVAPAKPVEQPTGFNWLATSRVGLVITALTAVAALVGAVLIRFGSVAKVLGVLVLLGSAGIAFAGAVFSNLHPASVAQTLRMSLPVISPGEDVQVVVKSVSGIISQVSAPGLIAIICGVILMIWSLFPRTEKRGWLRGLGVLLAAGGLLLHHDGATYFFLLVAAAIAIFLALPVVVGAIRRGFENRRLRHDDNDDGDNDDGEVGEDGLDPDAPGAATTLLVLGALILGLGGEADAKDAAPPLIADGFIAAESIEQEWSIADKQLTVSGRLKLSGRVGEQILFLRPPAVLKSFEGEGLRITRRNVSGLLSYVVHIAGEGEGTVSREATFGYVLDVENVSGGISVPTGPAAVQRIAASYEKPGWEFLSAAAMRITPGKSKTKSTANLLLSPLGNATVILKPRSRDVSAEETQFFIEGFNLYTPGPGVVNGRHRVRVRPAQGEVSELAISVPEGLTVSEVAGPVSSWQFDADARILKMVIEPAQSTAFDFLVETQRVLDELPAEVSVSPLMVAESKGQVGLIALAFGADAQPEKVESETLSVVNAGDFDGSLLKGTNASLHQVFRYGKNGGDVSLRVAAVAPEIRVQSSQKLSFGDERILLAVNFNAEVTRAGVFSLSMPLPDGFEVESLTGAALNHWAEVTEEGVRTIVLRLNGKTLGQQAFSLVLTGNTPEGIEQWTVPRFEIREASRQEGNLVVVPTTGIRLRTLDRKNVSETDPRKAGGTAQGSLAFRLLQHDWSLELGIEKLDPWITGRVLHDVTLREGQTRTSLIALFNVQNASVRSLRVDLPVTIEDEIKTVRASGGQVSDLVRVEGEATLWEIQFKRRIIGDVEVQIDFERRGERESVGNGSGRQEFESINAVKFPELRQVSYHVAVRAGGRLELRTGELPQGWQRVEWTTVPQQLRDSGTRLPPMLTMRAVNPEAALRVELRRHSLAESLKLRVSTGTLTTVLSPLGDQMTEVVLAMVVIERSSLTVGLPAGGELFNIFVNGESVNTVREVDTYQFHILPGADDRTASVRFVYSVRGDQARKFGLQSPVLNVPLENIEWRLHVPNGFELLSSKGDLELRKQSQRGVFLRENYLSIDKKKRMAGQFEARELLDQAARYALQGEQEKANWAFRNVANRSGLDAASNEDARVQLENLQTQQAMVGINTRRQRLYLANAGDGEFFTANDQLQEGATNNPILAKNDVNFKPQDIGQLLLGNTTEENAVLHRIAGRIVAHQQAAEPAAQAITITLPEEGNVYTFTRTVQVRENVPLALEIVVESLHRGTRARHLIVALLLLAVAAAFVLSAKRRERPPGQA